MKEEIIKLDHITYKYEQEDVDKFKKENPFSSYRFGYIVFDTKYGYVPDKCNDWNDSPEEAMFDFEENCNEN